MLHKLAPSSLSEQSKSLSALTSRLTRQLMTPAQQFQVFKFNWQADQLLAVLSTSINVYVRCLWVFRVGSWHCFGDWVRWPIRTKFDEISFFSFYSKKGNLKKKKVFFSKMQSKLFDILWVDRTSLSLLIRRLLCIACTCPAATLSILWHCRQTVI